MEQSKRCAKGRPVTSTNPQGNKKRFANLVQRDVKTATRVITTRDEDTVLKADDITDCKGKKITVLEQLKEKHPVASRVQRGTVDTTSAYPAVEDIVITSVQIEKTARKLCGSAGPSGADSDHWKSVLLRFRSRSELLRDCIATLACKMSNEVLPWKKLRALMSCRLIALDKRPGIRPVGIGECLRRLLAKSISDCTKGDLSEYFGIDQLAGGLEAGIEGAIHSLSDLFDSQKENGVGLLMDAKIALHSLNRSTALLNIRRTWPRACTFLFNCYQGDSPLIMPACKETLYSQEGTTQGDTLAMLFHECAIMPLIQKLKTRPNVCRNGIRRRIIPRKTNIIEKMARNTAKRRTCFWLFSWTHEKLSDCGRRLYLSSKNLIWASRSECSFEPLLPRLLHRIKRTKIWLPES